MIAKFLLITLCIHTGLVFCEDLGSVNFTYPKDLDAREQLKSTMQTQYSDGRVQEYWRDYANQAVKNIEFPSPLAGVTTSYRQRSELVGIRYKTVKDFKFAPTGLLIPKGTVIEPLKLSRLQYNLLFIDGRDQRQLDYAIQLNRDEKIKIILTGGSAVALRQQYKNAIWMGQKTIPFYFDQRKMIINQLARIYNIHIDQVPVKLSQQGALMRIDWGMN